MSVSCPLCKGYNCHIYSPASFPALYSCETCHLKFRKDYSVIDIKKFYDDEYGISRGHESDPYVADCKRKTFHNYLSLLEGLAPDREKLLEIGCSTGFFLEVAVSQGWNVRGIDVSSRACKIANIRLGYDAVTGDLQDIPEDDYFSVVAMFDVIEHIPDPVHTLNYIKDRLKKGGIILIITPNIESLSCKLLKSRWPHLLDEHILYYSPRSLSYLASISGFDVIKFGVARKHINLAILQRHWRLHPHVFGSRSISRVVDKLPAKFLAYPFSFNLGEICAVLKKR